MKITRLNGGKPVNVAINKYLIDWERKVSKPQKLIKDVLHPFWKNHCVVEEFRIPGSLLRLDLWNMTRNVIIEISPSAIHLEYNPFMHGSKPGFLHKIKADMQKRKWAEINGIRFIELYDEDIKHFSPKYAEEKLGFSIV